MGGEKTLCWWIFDLELNFPLHTSGELDYQTVPFYASDLCGAANN
jgi:hypothetical protein